MYLFDRLRVMDAEWWLSMVERNMSQPVQVWYFVIDNKIRSLLQIFPSVNPVLCLWLWILPEPLFRSIRSTRDHVFKTEPCFHVSDVVPLLFQVINGPESRSRENVNATENAISAVAKICKYNRGNIALNEVVPALIAALPITEDKEEAPHVYGYLCDLIEE